MKNIKSFNNFEPINEAFYLSKEMYDIVKSHKENNLDILDSLDEIKSISDTSASFFVYVVDSNNNDLIGPLKEDETFNMYFRFHIKFKMSVNKLDIESFSKKTTDLNLLTSIIEEMIDRSGLELAKNVVRNENNRITFLLELKKEGIDDEVRAAYKKWLKSTPHQYIELLDQLKKIYKNEYNVNLDDYLTILDTDEDEPRKGRIHIGFMVDSEDGDIILIGDYNKSDQSVYIDKEEIKNSIEEIRKS